MAQLPPEHWSTTEKGEDLPFEGACNPAHRTRNMKCSQGISIFFHWQWVPSARMNSSAFYESCGSSLLEDWEPSSYSWEWFWGSCWLLVLFSFLSLDSAFQRVIPFLSVIMAEAVKIPTMSTRLTIGARVSFRMTPTFVPKKEGGRAMETEV